MNPLQFILIVAVRLYRWVLSPAKLFILGPNRCRFTPTCSEYALEALQKHGALRGSWLAGKRLLRCHPWGPWGADPVPPVQTHTHSGQACGCQTTTASLSASRF